MQDIARQMPEYSIFTAGYLIRDPEHLAKVYGGPIGEEVNRRIAEALGIQLLQAVYLGTRQVSLAQPRTVRTPADLAGVKLRMPGSKEWLFLGQALGANPTPLAFTEVYLGLKTGTIDGQDNPLPTLKSAKFYEVTRQIVLTGHLVDALQLAISSKTWHALSAAHRAQMKRAAAKAASFNDENRVREENHGARRGRVQEDRAGSVPEVRVRGEVAARTPRAHQCGQIGDGPRLSRKRGLSPVFWDVGPI